MMNKIFGIAGFMTMLTVSALAQTQPAQMGITPTTAPEVLQTLDNTKTWVPLGTVDSSTHKFSVVGGGGGGYQYQTHAALLAGVTTAPSPPQAIGQQGFYAPGDGGAAIYQWSPTSLCTITDSGAHPPANGLTCVLPTGQSSSTPGRYLLQMDSNGIDVRQMGMVGDGVFDNSTLNDALMDVINPENSQSGQNDVWFPNVPGRRYTDYYFSKTLHFYKPANIRCQGIPNGGGDSSVRLVFPAGVNGVVFDNYYTSPFPLAKGMGQGGMSGCGIVSKGFHQTFQAENGDTTINNVPVDKYFHTWDWAVGDSIIPYQYASPGGAPNVPPGTVITATNPATHSITLSNPLSVNYAGGNKYGIWRLPAEKAFTINTVAGSGNFTITGGPSKLVSGDYIWSDAFPLGATVLTYDGTAGSQNIGTGPYDMNYTTPTLATKTETGGSMWLLPAALKTNVGYNIKNNFFSTFPWGLYKMCSQWGTAKAGCSGGLAEQNIFMFSMIGQVSVGSDSGATASIMNVYSGNTIADIGEFGSVGSNYFAENANSSEAHSSENGIIGNCVNSNSSSFFGGYAPNNSGYCAHGIGVPTTPGGAVVFWNPIAGVPTGAPTTFNGIFYNPWGFTGPDGISLCMNQPGNALIWSHDSAGCGGGANVWDLTYRADLGAWTYLYFGISGGQPMWLTEGFYGHYAGYQAGTVAMVNFPQGFLLNDNALGGGNVGSERLVDAGVSVPTAAFHQLGDIHFNQVSPPGGSLAWIDTYSAFTNLGAAVVSGTTTSVPVGACPSPALPVGTPITVQNSGSPSGKTLGTLASCTAGTLTFQAAASNNANSGDQILFLQWRPAGPVAADTGGVVYPLGKAVAIGSLPVCGAAVVGYATVTDGIASPTYMQAVSATGSSKRPVFCDGTSWTYH